MNIIEAAQAMKEGKDVGFVECDEVFAIYSRARGIYVRGDDGEPWNPCVDDMLRTDWEIV